MRHNNSKCIVYRLRPTLNVCAILLVVAAVSDARGQTKFTLPQATDSAQIYKGQGPAIVLTVLSDRKLPLDRQSVVKLYSRATKTTTWQTTTDRSQVVLGDLNFGLYDIEVSAVGYLTVRKQVEVASAVHTVQLEIVLPHDPAAVDLSARDALMSPKARKETNRGIYALKSGNLKEAQKRLDAARALAPSSPDLNFLMGYLSFQQKDFEQAQAYLDRAVTLDPQDVQALTLLGRIQLQRQDYEKARSTLEQAAAADPDYWMVHNLLADAYFGQHQYEKARAQAELAVKTGKGEGNAAQLVLGEALANLGQVREGVEALNAFLQAVPESPLAPQVRSMIASFEQRSANPAQHPEVAPKAVPTADPDPVLAASVPSLSVKTWEPRGIDDAHPSVAAGVACPYDQLIDKTGERVKQFVDNVAKYAAIEDLVHERIDKQGNPVTKETRKFDYVASISEDRLGVLLVNEFRNERYGVDDLPDQIVTKGFPALALVFHPDMRDNYEMTCEGLGQLYGQATWLVHFRQRDDRPNHMQDYHAGNQDYPIKMKGRAWITADQFQIVRIESELTNPMPQIQLLTEHQIAEYGPVRFGKKDVELWLPKSVDLYLDFRRQRFHRRHSFDHFMLFSVDAEDKVRESKGDPHGPGSTVPRSRKRWWV